MLLDHFQKSELPRIQGVNPAKAGQGSSGMKYALKPGDWEAGSREAQKGNP